MKIYIQDFVASHDTCKGNKGKKVNIPGALKSLPIPTQIWIGISMDFIMGLPKARNK
jgi:hypothetical protein